MLFLEQKEVTPCLALKDLTKDLNQTIYNSPDLARLFILYPFGVSFVIPGCSSEDLIRAGQPAQLIEAALAEVQGSDLRDFAQEELKAVGLTARQLFPDSLGPTAWFRYMMI